MLISARCRRVLVALVLAGALSPVVAVSAQAADAPTGPLADLTAELAGLADAAGSVLPTLVVDPAPLVTPSDRSNQSAGALATPSVAGSQTAAYPLASTFALHSSPSSALVIYLDFDGETIGSTAYPDATEGRQPAFSLDADTSTFSDAERTEVQEVWQSVAEDFAPFDVDVTTEQPAANRITRDSAADQVYGTRVLITGSRTVRSSADQAVCRTTCGGLAYTGSFDQTTDHDQFQPAWVFPQNLGDTSKAIAESAAHEAGHTLGLRHDGNASTEYEPGHGSWGPIMGGPYNTPVSQWSRGDYAGATNGEDDLAVIASHGPARRADDVTGSVAAATAVPAPSGAPSATGTIADRSDVDVFALGTCSGAVTAAAAPAARFGADVDLAVRILDAAGTELAAGDTPTTSFTSDRATGLDASASTTLPTAAPLFVAVEGVGSGSNASTGYTDYGSLGRYLVSTTGSCSGARPAVVTATAAPGAPSGLVATPTGAGSARIAWSAPAGATSYVVSVGRTDLLVAGGATSQVVDGLAPGTSYPVAVQAVNAAGRGGSVSGTLTTSAATAAAASRLGVRTAPALRGRSAVGSTLKIVAGTYDRPAATAVRWFAAGKAVGTGSRLKVTSATAGKKITAKVTASATGVPSVVTTLTSRAARR